MQKKGGRQKGTPNKLTSSFREAVLFAFENIGGHKTFSEWARQNQTEFYRIAARLIPAEINTTSNEVTVIVNRSLVEAETPVATKISSPLLIGTISQE
jgi:hypothetical protein